MNTPRLDLDTAERMLRGEPTGQPILAELLTAASSEPATKDVTGEDAAVAAFREARSLRSRQPGTRRFSVLINLKAVLIGLLLLLAGGITVAATSQHLPGPLGNKHAHGTPTPTTPRALITRTPLRASSHPTPDRHEKHEKQPRKTAHPTKYPHPTKNPKGNARKTNPHNPNGLTGPVPVASTSPARKSDPGGNNLGAGGNRRGSTV